MIALIKVPLYNNPHPVTLNINHVVSWYKVQVNHSITDVLTVTGVVYTIGMPEEEFTKSVLSVLRSAGNAN